MCIKDIFNQSKSQSTYQAHVNKYIKVYICKLQNFFFGGLKNDVFISRLFQADVEKMAYNGEEAVPQIIGTLTEGAVLGDVTW